MAYSNEVMEHFKNPRNMGELENPDGIGEAKSPVCGDVTKITIKVKDSKIIDIKFQTFGCITAIATASMLTELAKGKTIEEAEKLTNKDIADKLGGLPPAKMHCSNLAADALKKAIENYKQKQRN